MVVGCGWICLHMNAAGCSGVKMQRRSDVAGRSLMSLQAVGCGWMQFNVVGCRDGWMQLEAGGGLDAVVVDYGSGWMWLNVVVAGCGRIQGCLVAVVVGSGWLCLHVVAVGCG